jgi:hypothetical protein
MHLKSLLSTASHRLTKRRNSTLSVVQVLLKFAQDLAREKGVPLREDIEAACTDEKLLASMRSLRAAAAEDAPDGGIHGDLFSMDLRDRAKQAGIPLPEPTATREDVKTFFDNLLA